LLNAGAVGTRPRNIAASARIRQIPAAFARQAARAILLLPGPDAASTVTLLCGAALQLTIASMAATLDRCLRIAVFAVIAFYLE
jgi:hypothetical protein